MLEKLYQMLFLIGFMFVAAAKGTGFLRNVGFFAGSISNDITANRTQGNDTIPKNIEFSGDSGTGVLIMEGVLTLIMIAATVYVCKKSYEANKKKEARKNADKEESSEHEVKPKPVITTPLLGHQGAT